MSSFASKESLAASAGKRRYRDEHVPGVGTVRYRSLTGSEFARTSAAQTRMVMACNARDTKAAERATREYHLATIVAGVCDENSDPIFTPDDRELIESLDAGIVERLVAGVTSHAGLDSLDVESVAKNSEGTA
jgi:hypothetical protein